MRERQPQFYSDHFLSLTLLPCGAVDRAELNDLARGLSVRGMDVRIAKERPLPQQAFNPRRRQYRADDFLTIARSEVGGRVLAVTNCDLYADNLNFVFGLADSPGKCAVISLFRLRMGAEEQTFCRRAEKEAVHEISHTLGMSHCANPRCVMHFSNSLEDTDRKGAEWCGRCAKQLQSDPKHTSQAQTDGGGIWLL
jgi:archaemetzincin